jgi:hypothetical protein
MAVQNCASGGGYVGSVVPLEIAIACGDVDPATLTFQRLGSLTVKSFTAAAETTGTMTDTSSGGFTDTIATGATFEVQGDGVCRKSGTDWDFHKQLVKQYFENLAAKITTNVYIRMPFPDLTFTVFCAMTTYDRNGDTSSEVTFSTAFAAAESTYNNNIVSETP